MIPRRLGEQGKEAQVNCQSYFSTRQSNDRVTLKNIRHSPPNSVHRNVLCILEPPGRQGIDQSSYNQS